MMYMYFDAGGISVFYSAFVSTWCIVLLRHPFVVPNVCFVEGLEVDCSLQAFSILVIYSPYFSLVS